MSATPVGMCAWHESESLRLDNRTSPELRGPLVCILITSLALTTAHSPGDQIRTSIKAIEPVVRKAFVIMKGFADGSEKGGKKVIAMMPLQWQRLRLFRLLDTAIARPGAGCSFHRTVPTGGKGWIVTSEFGELDDFPLSIWSTGPCCRYFCQNT